MWNLILLVSLAGLIGGFINALITDNGFVLPKQETTNSGTILRPGWIGNVLIGIVASVCSWGLYGPFANYVIAGVKGATATANSPEPSLTLASFVGAILIGIGGARWLTSAVDKKLLTAAAATAADGKSDADSAGKIALASPTNALKIAMAMKKT